MIDLVALLAVFAATIGGSAVVVALCSLGLRLLVTRPAGPRTAPGEPAGARSHPGRPVAATAGAYACFTACAMIVLFAIYLIVPLAHR